MARRGEFYDQDDDHRAPSWAEIPAPGRKGRLYDQDAAPEPRPEERMGSRTRRDPERRRVSRPPRPAPADDAAPSRAGWEEIPPAPPPVRISSRTTPVVFPPPAPVAPIPPGPILPRGAPEEPPAGAEPAHLPPQRTGPGRGTADRGAPVRGGGGTGARRSRPQHQATAGPSTGRATAIIAFGTFTSRVTGFLRVLAIGYVLGVGSLSDAFNYANGVPNIIYDLLLGGILSATLIPVFVEQLNRERQQEGDRAVSAVFTSIGLALVAVSGLLWLIAPWLIRFYLLLNPASTGPAERSLATNLLRYFSPQVFFLGTIVASTALLNARRRFAAAAFSPVLNNLIAIAALLVTKFVASSILTARNSTPADTLSAFDHDHRALLILGLGTTAGYVAQLLVQLPAMARTGIRMRPVWDPMHPAVRRVAGLSSWLVGVVLANQASLALVMILAGKTSGGVTAYQFSYQFFQLPYALIAVSVASAIMPDLAERWTARNRVAFERQLVSGIRTTLALLVPVGLVYAAVAQPFIQIAIHHGRVGESGAHLVASSLVWFALGLPGFSAFFLLMRAYQAMQDARTMFWIYVIENVLTVVLALALSPVMGVPGLALAWVAPYTVASLYAVVKLRGRVGSLGGWLTIRALIRMVLASVCALAATLAVGAATGSHHGDAVLMGRLLLQVGIAAGVYVWVAQLLHVRELRPLIALGRRMLASR